MNRFSLVSVLLLFSQTSALAALDPEAARPYQVRIIVHLTTHPAFTPLFKDRLMRGLHDGLQTSLGKLVQVEVLDKFLLEEMTARKADGDKGRLAALERALKLLQDITDHGLESPLDNWKEVSDTKTHFVAIDFADGQYVIQARQFDGFTGLAGPVVRQASTRDHAFVLRLAGFLIDKDFGWAGTLTHTEKKDEVLLTLKAGNLGQPLTPWVKKGEIFAVSQLFQSGSGMRAERLGETLIQVLENPQDGKIRGRILHRYEPALPAGPTILGYRCLKLGTTQAPLRIRLVDEKGKPRAAQHITVSADDFGVNIKEDTTTNADGFTEALGPFQHVAFVSVLRPNGKLLAQLPIEILDDRPVVRQINVDAKVEQLGQSEFVIKYLLKSLDESHLAASGLADELNATQSNDEKLKKIKAGLTKLVADLAGYNEELIRLRGPGNLNLSVVQDRYDALQTKKDKFQHYMTELEEAIAVEKDPLRADLRELAGRARLLESEFEFDQAIELYEQLVQKAGSLPGFEAHARHLAKLKKAWEPKNEQHRQARQFIYRIWPKLETAAQIKAQMDSAFKALQTCKEVNDRKSPLKLLKANTAHATNLANRLQKIISSTKAEEQNEGKIIIELQEGLERLTKEASQFARENGGQ
jgi:hypothetical protein